MMPHPILGFASGFTERLLQEALLFRKRGQEHTGILIESLVEDFHDSVSVWLDEPITLQEACEYSGLAYSTLSGLVRSGSLPNCGERGRPRLQRRFLPWKGGYLDERADSLASGPNTIPVDPSDPAAELIARELSRLEEG